MEDIELSMRALYIAKAFADAGKLEKLIDLCGDQLREDSYYEYISCAWEIISESAYINYKRQYEYDYDITHIYFSEPVMVEYYRLCEEYGRRHRLKEKDNPYYKDARTHVNYCLSFNAYCYDYEIITGTAKKRSSGIHVVFDDEFYEHQFLFAGLLEAFDYYKNKVNELKQVLESEKIVPLSAKKGRQAKAALPAGAEKEAA